MARLVATQQRGHGHHPFDAAEGEEDQLLLKLIVVRHVVQQIGLAARSSHGDSSCCGKMALCFKQNNKQMHMYLDIKNTNVCMYVCVCTYVRTYVLIYVCVCVRVYVRTYVRTYIHNKT